MEPETVAMLVTRNNKSVHRATYHNFKNRARVSCHATKAYLTGLSCHSIGLDICLSDRHWTASIKLLWWVLIEFYTVDVNYSRGWISV